MGTHSQTAQKNLKLNQYLTYLPKNFTALMIPQGDRDLALDIWDEVNREVRNFVAEQTQKLTTELSEQLELDRAQASKSESDRYQSRQGEVSSLIESSTMQRIEREIEELKEKRKQGVLFIRSTD